MQLTDSHLPEAVDMRVSGVYPDCTLQRVIRAISQHLSRRADLLLATGDIADTGSSDAYARFLKYAQALAVPVYGLPGNHDNAAVFYEVWGEHAPQWVDTPRWRIVLLDSTMAGRDEGYLGAGRLAQLRKLLEGASGHVLVVVHHPPVRVQVSWLDEVMLGDADALFECLQDFGQVKAVVCGHVHQAHEVLYQRKGRGSPPIRVLTSPSSAFQFAPRSPVYRLDTKGPAYRWLLLHPDGTLDTAVKYLSHDESGTVEEAGI